MFYTGVYVNGKLFKHINKSSWYEIEEILSEEHFNYSWDIRFVLNKTKSNPDKVFRTIINKERRWENSHDKLTLYTENKFRLDETSIVQTKNFLYDSSKKRCFDLDEENGNKETYYIWEIFKKPKFMFFNTFPNTYINFTSPYQHQYLVYNYASNSTRENVLDEMMRTINVCIQSDESLRNPDIAESIVYLGVLINDKFFSYFDEK